MEATIRCVCEGSPHETDTIVFRDRLDFRRAATIKGDIVVMKLDKPDSTPGEILAVMSEGYMRQGIESWTLVGPDEKGLTVRLPVTQANIEARILSDLDVAMELADIADDLYSEAVMRPLFRSASQSSPDTSTDSSTSQEPSPSERTDTEERSTSPTLLPTPSKRSSTTTTPTAGIARTTASHGGASSSSQSSTSAA